MMAAPTWSPRRRWGLMKGRLSSACLFGSTARNWTCRVARATQLATAKGTESQKAPPPTQGRSLHRKPPGEQELRDHALPFEPLWTGARGVNPAGVYYHYYYLRMARRTTGSR